MPVDSWLPKVSVQDASVGDNASLRAFFNVRSNDYLVESGIARAIRELCNEKYNCDDPRDGSSQI